MGKKVKEDKKPPPDDVVTIYNYLHIQKTYELMIDKCNEKLFWGFV